MIASSQLEPSFVLQPPSAGLRLLDVAPNPSDRPELCVALYAQPGESSVDAGTAIVLDIRQGSWGAQLETNSRTSCCEYAAIRGRLAHMRLLRRDSWRITPLVSWSVKGKQVALGLESGEIAQLTPEGEEKARIPRPSDLEGQYYGTSLRL